MSVDRITVHHEGAGAPQVHNLSQYGYTVGIHPTGGGYERWRSAAESFATAHENHVSFDIVLFGNRDVYPVTDAELWAIAAAVHDGCVRGEIAAYAETHPHGTLLAAYYPAGTPAGTSPTECPGLHAAQRFGDIRRAINGVFAALGHLPGPPPANPHPVLSIGASGSAVVELQRKLIAGFGQHIAADGAFGPATRAAVMNAQTWVHIPADGIVGPVTWRFIDSYAALKGVR